MWSILLLLLSSLISFPSWAAGPPDFSTVLSAMVINGLILAIMSVAVLAVGVVLAKAGANSFVRFISRIVGEDQVRVGKYGFFDKDVYEMVMGSLDRYKRDGGRFDRETQAEYNKWRFRKHLEAEDRQEAARLDADDLLVAAREEERITPWILFDFWRKEDEAQERHEKAVDREVAFYKGMDDSEFDRLATKFSRDVDHRRGGDWRDWGS